MQEITLRTERRTQLVEITPQVEEALNGADGAAAALVYVPHTTAGITINENADPDVVTDMLYALEKAVPWKDARYRHGEGNTAAHVKSSLMGHSAQVFVRDGKLQFGTWQGIFLCEFDGPRSRKIWVSVRS